MSEWIEFNEIPNEGKKTRKFQVVNKNHGFPLGDISFFPRWRQYVFIPAPGTVFSNGCLSDIYEFIKSLKRKEAKP